MKPRYLRVAKECRGKFVIGMDATQFFELYMPWDASTPEEYRNQKPPSARKKSLRMMPTATIEKDMYINFVDALNGWPLSVKRKGNKRPENAFETELVMYEGKKDACAGGVAPDIFQLPKDRVPEDSKNAFAWSVSHVEMKLNQSHDPFIDPNPEGESEEDLEAEGSDDQVDLEAQGDDSEEGSDGAISDVMPVRSSIDMNAPTLDDALDARFPYERRSEAGRENRGQIASYAGISMHMAFRAHLFTLLVAGPYIRFIRWDRRGAVVTRRIKYDEDPSLIFEFYARIAQLPPKQRGVDDTVRKLDVPGTDSAVADAALKAFDQRAEEILRDDPYPIPGYGQGEDNGFQPEGLLWMDFEVDGEQREVIITPPRFNYGCLSPFSRSTRHSLAYNPETGQVYFMKDYWREDSVRTKPEAQIYKMLKEAKIPHVADMEFGGDVPCLHTQWQDPKLDDIYKYFPDGWRDKFRQPLQCHRIFLNTIARDLRSFRTAKNLVNCVADAVEALEAAHSKLKILHRDISIGNIMIDTSGDVNEGVLIDWDHCIILDNGESAPRGERTGTWQFISVQLLDLNYQQEPVVHTIQDDRESIFWVLVYMAYRFLPHNEDGHALYKRLVETFDDCTIKDQRQGNTKKRYSLYEIAETTVPIVNIRIPGMNELLQTIGRAAWSRYIELDEDDLEEYKRSLGRASGADKDRVKSSGRMKPFEVFIRLEQLQSSTWLLETLRDRGKEIPLPSKVSQDFFKHPLIADPYMHRQQIRTSTARLDSGNPDSLLNEGRKKTSSSKRQNPGDDDLPAKPSAKKRSRKGK